MKEYFKETIREKSKLGEGKAVDFKKLNLGVWRIYQIWHSQWKRGGHELRHAWLSQKMLDLLSIPLLGHKFGSIWSMALIFLEISCWNMHLAWGNCFFKSYCIIFFIYLFFLKQTLHHPLFSPSINVNFTLFGIGLLKKLS